MERQSSLIFTMMRNLYLWCLFGSSAGASGILDSAHSQQALVSVMVGLRHDPLLLDALEELVYERADTNSPRYGHWLSPEEVRTLVASTEANVAIASEWVEHKVATLCNDSVFPFPFELRAAGHGNYLETTPLPLACAARLEKAFEQVAVEESMNSAEDGSAVIDIVFMKRGLHFSQPPPSQQSSSATKNTKTSDDMAARGAAAAATSQPPPVLPSPPSSGRQRATAAFQRAALAGAAPALTQEPIGAPPAQKEAYGIPTSAVGGGDNTLQLVWGPGTFGYLPSDLETFYAEFNVSNTDSELVSAFGNLGEVGGDNFYEGSLDVTYISSMGAGASTVVANTNASSATEETTGFGYALLEFSQLLATAGLNNESGSLPSLPSVVSMSLGSLSFDSCQLLCSTLVAEHPDQYSSQDCADYMATQRQVCMFDSAAVVERINLEFLIAAGRGVTLLAATGDGGSHFSFGAFPTQDDIGANLNDISCRFALPTFPAESPFVLGVGGEQWDDTAGGKGASPDNPVYWYAGGAGFSRRFKRPRYQDLAVPAYLQTAPLPPPDSFQADMRAYPDVVALAWGVPMVVNGKLLVTGGTSASAPSFAGVVTLLNALRFKQGLPSLGFLHPRLYAAAAAAAAGGSSVASRGTAKSTTATESRPLFFDITVGNSSVGGDGYQCPSGFVAWGGGWDAATGWGSPRWDGLVDALASDS